MITQTRGVKRNFFLMRLLFGDAGESSFRSQAYLGYFGGDKRSQARLGESSLSRRIHSNSQFFYTFGPSHREFRHNFVKSTCGSMRR